MSATVEFTNDDKEQFLDLLMNQMQKTDKADAPVMEQEKYQSLFPHEKTPPNIFNATLLFFAVTTFTLLLATK